MGKMEKREITREEVLKQLAAFGITGKDLYFIDYIPLIEMIWADGQAQQGELDLFFEFIEKHVAHLNKMAGYSAFKLEEAVAFVSGFLKKRPSPEMLKTLRNLAACTTMCIANKNGNNRAALDKSLLALCIDIAASCVTEYPYGLHDRFNAAEKKCYFEILDALENRNPAEALKD
jgi:hypothetical protein